MDAATHARRASAFSALLAGLQAGTLGTCWMLAWLGVSATWERRSFWTAENLMASVFYGDRAIRSGFAGQTLSGMALYILMYSALGALFAMLLGGRLRRLRTLLVSVLFALGWYYLSFRFLWKSLMPLVALLHSGQSTVLGHVVYGTFLGRYPVYLPRPATAEPTPIDAGTTQETSGEPAALESGSETQAEKAPE